LELGSVRVRRGVVWEIVDQCIECLKCVVEAAEVVVLSLACGGDGARSLRQLKSFLRFKHSVDFPLLQLRKEFCRDMWIGGETGVDEDSRVGCGGGPGGGERGLRVGEEKREDVGVVGC